MTTVTGENIPIQPAKISTVRRLLGARGTSDRLLIVVLVLFACVPYVNVLFNGFVYDDDTQLLANPYVRNFHYLRSIFTGNVWAFEGASGYANYYRPLMTFGYLLCHAIFGFRAWAFHLLNLGFNAGVVCLVFVLTRHMFRDRRLAFLAAALFALHPIHTEAVDWIGAITDLELAFFFLLTFWFFLRLEDSDASPPGMLYLGMTASYALALLSKEPAATLPFLATFFEHTCREDRATTSWILKLRRYAVLWLLLLGYILFRICFLGAFVPSPQRASMPYNEVFFSAVALVGQYLEKMTWPVHLSLIYVFPADMANLLPAFLGGAAGMLASALLMIYFWRRDRRVCFGFVWFFVTLAPVLNVRWMPADVFSERYLYLPSAGLCWVAAWAGVRVWEQAQQFGSLWRQALVGATCLLAALFAVRIMTRNPDWKNDFTLYTKTLAVAPNSAIIHNNLGIYYADHGDEKDAAAQWNAALKLMPNAKFVLNNLGLMNRDLKRYQEAIVFYERSLALSPGDERAHLGLGEVYQALGLRQQAESELRRAIALSPLDVLAREHLAQIYLDEHKYGEAEKQYRAAIESLPSVRAYTGLGVIRWAEGDHVGAQRLFATAMKLDPRDSRPYVMLGVLYAGAGRVGDAIREYEAGLKIDPGNQVARAQLAKLQRGSAKPR
ncbi:MAG TPA: tetratricopeptide repeat protein [Terriglobia bacterium]|nr:tetratricopeptide repeat protein [Terriglobia bacterium]